MADEDLVPVFMPPLASLLAHAEQTHDRRLTEDEIIAIRDKAACIMMERADAAQMTASRGYRDVEPEDCWADWHRLRSEMVGSYLPRIVLCAPGDERFVEKAKALLEERGVEVEVRDRDPRMARSFATCCRALSTEELARIEGHSKVVYALSPHLPSGDAVDAARTFLALAADLIEKCGAYGVKCDSSGAGHTSDDWLDLASSLDAGSAGPLVRAFVVPLIGDDRELYSCGMHLLGRPDLVARFDQLPAALHSQQELHDLFVTFATYLLDECSGPRHFGSGNTFMCHAEAPRVRALFELCAGYDEDDFFFNPFGRLRFVTA